MQMPFPAERKRETAFVEKYGPNIQRYGLTIVLEELNRHAKEPRWRMILNPKKVKSSKRPEFRPLIDRQDFSGPLWQAIARLLVSGDIYLVGQCPLCLKFFVKNRKWQKPCPACRKTYDNQLAAERQATLRRKLKRRDR